MIGLFEDYLYISFDLLTTPFLLLILKVIMNRFLRFIKDLPSFTRNISDEKYNEMVSKYVNYISQKMF